MANNLSQKKIPISVALNPELEAEEMKPASVSNKNRLLLISSLAVLIAIAASAIAKLLIHLINFITHISFYGNFSTSAVSPADNFLGIWVILIPAAGGLIVGLMAFYGSKAIRGHGIPEAMEQILTNQSKIKPTITYLKPLSSAISIGTGGPFGAEGPIIATGGALGSTIGQLLKITANERKILLTAGAAAGMSAIFGSPIAAIFLAIELLLFEFSPRSIIPVSLACITGATGHYLFFGQAPVFGTGHLLDTPSNIAIAGYSIIGIIIGLLSVFITRIVYFIEDSFEKLPVHWMWWPAIGGLAVGIIGYFSPRTLGVGYNNITDVLTGNLPVQIVASLCIFKFLSWAIALGSGTSGGTLAPLLTIGGSAGVLLAQLSIHLFPSAGITVPLAALVGMSAMFAGASRAFMTSIIFALETTGQSNTLVPLLAACSASYIISFFLMENTIMTEKISRRGVKAPTSYEPDLLEKINIKQVMETDILVFSGDNTVNEVINQLEKEPEYKNKYLIIATAAGEFESILNSSYLYSTHLSPDTLISSLAHKKNISVSEDDVLRTAVDLMAGENLEVLPVFSLPENAISGILSYKNILSSYKYNISEHQKNNAVISLKRRSLKILIRGQQIIRNIKSKNEA
ncbi:MAG: chloride channel protein [Chitinophagaceae bacterium]|nr:chloride channel protein [Chitinophagaceae bacterium]